VDLDAIHQRLFGQGYEHPEMGAYRDVFMARATDPEIRDNAQNGGVVSALMDFALREGIIDSALLTHRDEQQLSQGRAVTGRDGILACAGSSYVAGPTLEAFNRGEWKGTDRIGIVGIPCQVLALGKMKTSNLEKRTPVDQVSLVIGLFCTWALNHGPFLRFLRERLGTGKIEKVDITPPPERLLRVTMDAETANIPVDDIRPFIRTGCGVCLDMTSELADVSVGTVEGFEGWNTVIVRTDRGEDLWRRAEAAGVIEAKELPEENRAHLEEASLLKKRRALTALKERGEFEDGYLKLSRALIERILS
jgi:coenzyme F420 hydrogenase subunit beta